MKLTNTERWIRNLPTRNARRKARKRLQRVIVRKRAEAASKVQLIKAEEFKEQPNAVVQVDR